MQRALIAWTAAALTAVVFAQPAEARPRAVSRDGGSTEASAPSSSPRSPAPPPSSPAPAATSGDGRTRSAPAEPTTARAQSRGERGERRAPSEGGQATARPRTRGTDATAATTSGSRDDGERRAVRRGERPRDDRAAIGTAVARTRPRSTVPSWAWHRPSYWYGYHSVGLGYFYYDPYWWGYPGYGHGYGYYGPAAYGPAYGGYYVRGDRHLGNVRLKVKPKDAEVRVDGYYVGAVDQFDGVFQRLTLESGPHRIEIAKPGFAPLVLDIRVLPYDTVTYQGTLQPQ